ncbi:MAG: exo-alpha-sialidase [Chloroflexi bacterium]|nr:exo-alpha-sialidase [Chloroflexota bacterium]
MRVKTSLVYVLVLCLAVALLPLSVASAGDGDEGGDVARLKIGELASPTKDFSKMLSGRNWLITSGLDPVLGIGLGDVKEAPAGSRGLSPAQQAGGGGAALVPYRDPSARFSRNVLIPTDYTSSPFQTEPSIAVDPKDPDHLLVGLIDYNFPNMVSYVSIDGGASWQGPNLVRYPRKDLASAGDPIVTFDSKGNAYYAFISLDIEEFTVGPIASSAVVSAISVSRSTDGGVTWEDSIQASRSTVETAVLPSPDGRPRGEILFGFLDKPWMAVGPNPKDPTKDVLYVAYTNFVEGANICWIEELPFLCAPSLETVIQFVRSEDGGVTWSSPIEISPRAQYTILFNPVGVEQPQQSPDGQVAGGQVRQIVQGPDVAIGPGGEVYVAWVDTTEDDSFEGLAEIYVRRSDDAGATFQPRRLVSNFQELKFRSRTNSFRSWASMFPKLAVGPEGNVYVAWVAVPTDDPEDDGDVYVSVSTNKGQTWSRRLRVNDDQFTSFQFFPEVSTDPKGNVHMMWGDFRDDPKGVSFHIYYATSEDQGKTWSINSRVTDFPTNPNRAFPQGRFIGDYFGIQATSDEVYMVWADGRLGEFGPTNQKIAFARKKFMPNPSVFISPPSGPAGRDITVQGFNFQPARDIFIEVAGVIVSTARTQESGRFSTQIFVPISGRGAHSVRVIEESGNVASTSYFMDFGFDTIKDTTTKLDQVASQMEALQSAAAAPDTAVMADLQKIKDELALVKAAAEKETPKASNTGLIVGLAAFLLLPLALMFVVVIVMLRRRTAAVAVPVTANPGGPSGTPPPPSPG